MLLVPSASLSAPRDSDKVYGARRIPRTFLKLNQERTLSSAKKLITLERYRLSDDIIEAMECLKA